ncbi:LysR family transcriptional regulator [Sulfitobacter sp. W002]|uniref:LysR substrate-binding domain-containing protein n=1 Tax=unclassified Sulfitobacter TaxID=196795 RepID=UPI0021A3F6F5|nr:MULTISPECIES: LysR substrate-binding domain-containing protein [unclassified Sulfitobacter]UWR30937.1 LysR family transcriptional regulator [Sulfitobacter sp. W002]UWR38460.1 LysR family transcriptional regulator [Sulfitobacter sp. W074]
MTNVVDIKKLRTYVLVAELGSISAAARAAKLAQPAVSQHLKALEAEFGMRLFDRRRQGVVPTEAGQRLWGHATQILSHYDRARSEVQELQGRAVGPVTLGLPTTVAATVSAPLLRRMAVKHPEVRLRIVESMSGHLREWVDNGRVDLAVLFEALDAQRSDGEILLHEGLSLISSACDPRFADVASLPASALSGLPLVLPGRPHSLRVLIERFAAQNDISLDIRFELDATIAMRQMVAEDHAYTILSHPPVHADVVMGALRSTPIVSPRLERRLVFCRSPVHPFSEAFQAVRRELGQAIQALRETHGWESWVIKSI